MLRRTDVSRNDLSNGQSFPHDVKGRNYRKVTKVINGVKTINMIDFQFNKEFNQIMMYYHLLVKTKKDHVDVTYEFVIGQISLNK